MLKNATSDRAASITYSTAQLPYRPIWKNTAAIEDGYVTGLEPGTGYPYNRRIERIFGRVPQLGAGQTRAFAIDIGIHVGTKAVTDKAAQVEKIRAGRKAIVEETPPKPPEAP